MADFPVLAFLIEVTDRFGCERFPTGEHVVEDAGNLVRGRDDGFFGGTAGTPGAIKGAEHRVGSGAGLGRLSKGLPRTVADFQDVRAQHLAPGDVICGARGRARNKKCLLVGKRDMSVPISEMMVWASDSEMPMTSTTLDPVFTGEFLRA